MAETELLEEKQILETEARKLKIKEELAKAKARLSAYHNIAVDDIQITSKRMHNKYGNIKRRKCQVQEIRSNSRQKFTMATNYKMHGTNLIKGLKRKKTNSTRRQVTKRC